MTQKKVILGNASPSLQAWIIAMFAVVLYFNTLFYDYTLDDLLMITGNEYTKQGLKWEGGIQKILFTDALSGFLGENKNLLPGGRYRPLSQLWFSLEKEMFGFNPFVGHLFNVLLYSLTCVFLFFTLRKLFKPDKNPWHLAIPFLATMIFVAHPLHTEVVANIKGRDELLSLFFNISLIYCSVEYIKTQKTKFLLFLPFLFFLGILSKENTLTFLAVIPLTLFVFTKAKAKQYVFVLLMLFIGFGGYLILRYEALGFLMSTVPNLELLNSPFMEVEKLGMSKMATLFYTYAVYLKLLFFPHPLTHDYYPYHIELITWSNSVAIFSFLIYAALFVYAIIRIWRKDIIAYGILFYLAVFSIASNLLVNIGAFMNERFVFIALLGFAIIIAYLLNTKLKNKIKDNKSYIKISTTIFIIILIAFSIKTISRNTAWKDDYTLFTTDVHTSLNSVKCNTSAAGKIIERAMEKPKGLSKTNDLNLAIKYLTKAVEIHPKYGAAWVLMGNAYSFLDNYAYSRYYYNNALKLSKNNKDALHNLLYIAQEAARNKSYAESLKSYKLLASYKTNDLSLEHDMADVYLKMNNTDSAILILNSILEKDSLFFNAFTKLAEIYGSRLNQVDISYSYLMKAYEIRPNDVSNLENIGIIHGMKGHFEKSIEHFEKARKLEPENYHIYINIAKSYKYLGDSIKAKEFRKKAKELEGK